MSSKDDEIKELADEVFKVANNVVDEIYRHEEWSSDLFLHDKDASEEISDFTKN